VSSLLNPAIDPIELDYSLSNVNEIEIILAFLLFCLFAGWHLLTIKSTLDKD